MKWTQIRWYRIPFLLKYINYLGNYKYTFLMNIYDEVEIEDMDYDQETETYYYPCPCGDRF